MGRESLSTCVGQREIPGLLAVARDRPQVVGRFTNLQRWSRRNINLHAYPLPARPRLDRKGLRFDRASGGNGIRTQRKKHSGLLTGW